MVGQRAEINLEELRSFTLGEESRARDKGGSRKIYTEEQHEEG